MLFGHLVTEASTKFPHSCYENYFFKNVFQMGFSLHGIEWEWSENNHSSNFNLHTTSGPAIRLFLQVKFNADQFFGVPSTSVGIPTL